MEAVSIVIMIAVMGAMMLFGSHKIMGSHGGHNNDDAKGKAQTHNTVTNASDKDATSTTAD